jgi:2-amino-4-hydroxy-6-hydroxymethyldihydropteridine diphosphokinase
MHALSNWYETDPIPPGGPSYINGVAWLEGETDPAWLLGRLQAIEARGGRTRSVPNAPRTLDLDIIAMGDTVRDAPDPILPHPRAHFRRFVLEPLAEIAPFWIHPVLHRPVGALLEDLPPQGVRRLGGRPA